MTNTNFDSATMLKLNRVYRASRERLFRSWTDPELLKQWFAVSAGFTTPIAEVDLQVGGKYRLGMQPPGDDGILIAGGIYRQILPHEKLVFTWRWESPDPDEPETLVTVEFHEQEDGTEVVVTHELFTDIPQRDKHKEGWLGCLNQLEGMINSKSN
ncbi:MAG: SRPBCC domain-containing protein [Anaerolineales bacterium]|nr:SRPBCC domain-containing protein [Anaerolineales bacterium]